MPARVNRGSEARPAAARAVLFLSLLLLAPACVPGQRWHAASVNRPLAQTAPPLDNLAHTSWTRRDGAPSDITALAQTADGYLWIGSGLGLYRFDGLKFSPYPFTAADPQLPASDISALAPDPTGGLWIGYRMGGITHLAGGKKLDFNKSTGLVSESTEQLVCQKDGSVWATADGRLMRLTGATWENFALKHGLASEGLYSLFFDRDGNLWTAEKRHIYELKAGAGRFEEVPIPNKTVNQFAQLPDGAIWISDAWVNVRPLQARNAEEAVRIPGVPILLSDRDGSIWMAHDFGGLTRVQSPGSPAQKIENFKVADGLSDGQTRAILEDKQGAIWVGTARGLDRFQHTPLVKFHGAHLDYFPALIADQKDGIWLNDMDKPLMRLRAGRLTALDGIAHGSSSLYQDNTGGVWLLDPISHDFFRYTDDGRPPLRVAAPPEAREVETWFIGQDSGGNLIASFEGHGLWRHAKNWEQVKEPRLPNEAPLSVLRSKAGRSWLGYPHNQIVLETHGGFRAFDARQGLTLNTVLAFYDSEGETFVGGSDGLAYFDGQRFHSLQVRTRNMLRGISGIVKDRRNDLWLNGASGVIHIASWEWKAALRDPHYVMDFQVLNEKDGLIGTPTQSKPTPSAVMDKDGVLWFATSGHLVSLQPESVQWNREAPNVLMQSVLVNGLVYKFGNRKSISRESVSEDGRRLKSLEFDYIGVDLDSADRVTYQYRLEGQDKDWQDAGARGQAFYTNLAPANYRFHVRASNGTGKWSELTPPLEVAVQPAFYQTKWFSVFCLLSSLTALWLAYQRRVRTLTFQVQKRLEARAQERLRIARDLHDTLLQGIQGLILRFHFATEQLGADEPAREMLRAALDRADQVIHEGRDKVRELRSEKSQAGDLVGQLRQSVDVMQAESPALLRMHVDGDAKDLDSSVQEELFNIGREALTNAVRHAHAHHIDIRLTFGRRQVRLICSDDGAGISLEILEAGHKSGHYGILGMRERAVRLGCELHVESPASGGTRVEVSVPAKRAYGSAATVTGMHAFARFFPALQRQRNTQRTIT